MLRLNYNCYSLQAGFKPAKKVYCIRSKLPNQVLALLSLRSAHWVSQTLMILFFDYLKLIHKKLENIRQGSADVYHKI